MMFHSNIVEISGALNGRGRGMFRRDKFDSFEKFPRELISGSDSDNILWSIQLVLNIQVFHVFYSLILLILPLGLVVCTRVGSA